MNTFTDGTLQQAWTDFERYACATCASTQKGAALAGCAARLGAILLANKDDHLVVPTNEEHFAAFVDTHLGASDASKAGALVAFFDGLLSKVLSYARDVALDVPDDTVPQGPAAVPGREPAAKLGVPDDLLPELCKMIRAASADGKVGDMYSIASRFTSLHPELSALETETTTHEVAVHVKLECDATKAWYIRLAFHHHLERENGYDPGRRQLLLTVMQNQQMEKQEIEELCRIDELLRQEEALSRHYRRRTPRQ